MSFYNMFIEKVALPLGDFFLRTRYMTELMHWRQLGVMDKYRIASLQLEYLKRLLTYSTGNIPYYKGLEIPKNEDPLIYIKNFPILNKDIIRNNLKQMIQPNSKNLVSEKSSGSSGIQGEIFMTRHEQYNALAIQTYLWEWSGYRLGLPILQLGMTLNRSLVKVLKDKLLRTNYQQAFKIDEVEVLSAFQKLKGKSAFFGGYASGLYAYACFAEKVGVNVTFKSAISWGDKLFPHYKNKLEEVFGCKVYDTYGTTEGFIIAGQCQYDNYHILTPHVYLELLDEEGNEVVPGEIGRVVVTRLDAFSMPLIRYSLGDLAIKKDSKEECPCGRPFPMLQQIIGRDTDIVRTKTGKYLIVHFFTGIFEHVPEIRQFRIIQRNLEGIDIEYIPDNSFSNVVLQQIKEKIFYYIKEPFNINFHEVSFIPATPSGKPQIILSELLKS